MKVIARFSCDICQTIYDTSTAAQACEARGLEPLIVLVGDIVIVRAGFGWFNGDPRWVSNHAALGSLPGDQTLTAADRAHPDHGNCFSACCSYQFYYVVTAIDVADDDRHRRRYHVMTKAMANGQYGGYTYAEHHYRPVLVERPPAEIVADSKDLIGQLARHLL